MLSLLSEVDLKESLLLEFGPAFGAASILLFPQELDPALVACDIRAILMTIYEGKIVKKIKSESAVF